MPAGPVEEPGRAPRGEPLFTLEGVAVRRGGARILDGVDLSVPSAGVTVLIGMSGAGKSTVLRLCNRLEAPTSGTVRFRGTDVATLDPLAHRRRVAMVFQAPTPFPGTVLDNLRAVTPDLDAAGGRDLLDRVGLGPDALDRTADSLSGGEAQRLVLARALTTGPEVLLADEPTSALDATATTRLEALARTLATDGLPVVWVTHDLEQMRRLADHLVVLRAGRVAWRGPALAAGAEPAIARALAESEP